MEQWAHSGNSAGAWHRLDDHLRGTGELAGGFAEPFGGSSLARWLGRSHDLGKATCAWQEALARAAGGGTATGVPHKQHAARLSAQVGGYPSRAAVLAASALLGHHSGMPDRVSRLAGVVGTLDILGNEGLDGSVASAIRDLREAGFGDLGDEARNVTVPDWLPLDEGSSDPGAMRRLDMFTRMVFSALVDADYLDTEAHFQAAAGPRLAAATDFGVLFAEFEAARAEMLAAVPASPVAGVRQSVYEQVLCRAGQSPGLFRLPAPTGSGKTLTVAGFALRHAAANGQRRVVIAVPFTSITTQNAAVYRAVLDAPEQRRVLEHHSAVLDGQVGASRWRRLAAQNWDAPVVVTTTVQLFESLLANKPSKARRLHRLAGAVIVLDEVQALPLQLLPVILDVLRTLVDDYGATVVLSTATQPAFWALPVWADLPAVSLLPAEVAVRAALRRVTYQWRLEPKPGWPTVAGWVAGERQALVVVNTTSDAQALHRQVQALVNRDGQVLHLSTRMCGEHRQDTLERVRGLLVTGEPVTLVATQVIEAGVDVDFPVVYRALAPADSIAQAAGRANREGRLPGLGRVVVFDPADGRLPGREYKTATEITRQRFAVPGVDPDDPDALDGYYRALYAGLLPAGRSPAGDKVQAARADLAFRSAARAFRMIEDHGVPVVVDYHDPTGRAQALITQLGRGGTLTGDDWRYLQTRTATLPQQAARHAVAEGLAVSVTPAGQDDTDTGHLLWWTGDYDPLRGLDLDPAAGAEEVIW